MLSFTSRGSSVGAGVQGGANRQSAKHGTGSSLQDGAILAVSTTRCNTNPAVDVAPTSPTSPATVRSGRPPISAQRNITPSRQSTSFHSRSNASSHSEDDDKSPSLRRANDIRTPTKPRALSHQRPTSGGVGPVQSTSVLTKTNRRSRQVLDDDGPSDLLELLDHSASPGRASQHIRSEEWGVESLRSGSDIQPSGAMLPPPSSLLTTGASLRSLGSSSEERRAHLFSPSLSPSRPTTLPPPQGASFQRTRQNLPQTLSASIQSPPTSNLRLSVAPTPPSAQLDPYALRSSYPLLQNITLTSAKSLLSLSRRETVAAGRKIAVRAPDAAAAGGDGVALILSGVASISIKRPSSCSSDVAEALAYYVQAATGSESEKGLRGALVRLASSATSRRFAAGEDVLPCVKAPVMLGLVQALHQAPSRGSRSSPASDLQAAPLFEVEAITPCEVVYIPRASVSRMDEQDAAGVQRKAEMLPSMFIQPLPLATLLHACFADVTAANGEPFFAAALASRPASMSTSCRGGAAANDEAVGDRPPHTIHQEPWMVAAGGSISFAPHEVLTGGDADAYVVLSGRLKGCEVSGTWPFLWPDVGTVLLGYSQRHAVAATTLNCLKVKRSAIVRWLAASRLPADVYRELLRWVKGEIDRTAAVAPHRQTAKAPSSRSTARYVPLADVSCRNDDLDSILCEVRLSPSEVVGTKASPRDGENSHCDGRTRRGIEQHHGPFFGDAFQIGSSVPSHVTMLPEKMLGAAPNIRGASRRSRCSRLSAFSSSVSGSVSSNWLKLLPNPKGGGLEEGSMLVDDDGDDPKRVPFTSQISNVVSSSSAVFDEWASVQDIGKQEAT